MPVAGCAAARDVYKHKSADPSRWSDRPVAVKPLWLTAALNILFIIVATCSDASFMFYGLTCYLNRRHVRSQKHPGGKINLK